MALDPYPFEKYSPGWMVHGRQRYVDRMIWMQRNPRTWEPREWGRPPSGPHLGRRISFGMANLPDLPWNFYNQSPSFVTDNEGTGVVSLQFVCTTACLGAGRLFSSLPHSCFVEDSLEIPELGIP